MCSKPFVINAIDILLSCLVDFMTAMCVCVCVCVYVHACVWMQYQQWQSVRTEAVGYFIILGLNGRFGSDKQWLYDLASPRFVYCHVSISKICLPPIVLQMLTFLKLSYTLSVGLTHHWLDQSVQLAMYFLHLVSQLQFLAFQSYQQSNNWFNISVLNNARWSSIRTELLNQDGYNAYLLSCNNNT